jgi:hypothetical protein
MSNSESQTSNSSHLGHEPTDAKAKPIAISLIVIAALVFVSMLLMAWLMDLFQLPLDPNERIPAGLTDQQQIPPEPRLQAYPAADLERLRMREERELNSFEWVDKATGVMRIPIDRAMEIVAEGGLPVRQESGNELKQ